MMARSLTEWIGASDDTPIPPRVRLRVFEAACGMCAACERRLFPRDKKEFDHKIALINGGENRESNIQLLCAWCHSRKSKADVAEKSRDYRIKSRHNGLTPRLKKTIPGRKFNGAPIPSKLVMR